MMDNALALIIEDHTDIAALFCTVLQEAGFQTKVFQTGDMAVAWLEDVVPDVVVLGLHLPGIPGDEILHRIRADARMARTRVIVITAHTTWAETVQDEADLVLSKPVNINVLRRLVARLRSTEDWVSQGPLIIGPEDDIDIAKDA